MKREDKIKILKEYKEEKELVQRAEKRLKQLKAMIQANIDAGVYGDVALVIEEVDVKEYVVPARTDRRMKVLSVKS